jgi:hypothetical protein
MVLDGKNKLHNWFTLGPTAQVILIHTSWKLQALGFPVPNTSYPKVSSVIKIILKIVK